MNYLTFQKRFGYFPLVDLRDVYAVFPNFDRRRISEWREKGYLKRVANNFYTFADRTIDEKILFFIANKVYEPSYVSLETALAHHGLIPEAVFSIFSVSTSKTKSLAVSLDGGETKFFYKKIKKGFFFGYSLEKKGNFSYLVADPEKAVLDFLYFREDLRTRDDFFELRLNQKLAREILNSRKMNKYLKIAGSARLAEKISILRKIYA
jgi:predicted transcriptional regulator of viral defense system